MRRAAKRSRFFDLSSEGQATTLDTEGLGERIAAAIMARARSIPGPGSHGVHGPEGGSGETNVEVTAHRRLKELKLLSRFFNVTGPRGAGREREHGHRVGKEEHKLILILSGCSWASCGGGQRPVQLARSMASMGKRVVYHCIGDPLSFEQEGISIIGQDLIELVLERLEPLRGLCIVTLSTYLEQVERLKAAGWIVCYDLLDDWEAFAKHGDLSPELLPKEPRLFELADVVSCSATKLMTRAKRMGASKMVLIPNGGPERPTLRMPKPADMLTGEVTLVYAGYLDGSWFDWDALLQIADKRPAWVINVIGKHTNAPERANINRLGERPYAEVLNYLTNADCGLIPFRFADLCGAVDPIKYYDYLAAGIPTVATNVLPELRGRPLTYVVSPRSLVRAVEQAMAVRRPPLRELQRLVRSNSWNQRAKAMLDALDGSPGRRRT